MNIVELALAVRKAMVPNISPSRPSKKTRMPGPRWVHAYADRYRSPDGKISRKAMGRLRTRMGA